MVSIAWVAAGRCGVCGAAPARAGMPVPLCGADEKTYKTIDGNSSDDEAEEEKHGKTAANSAAAPAAASAPASTTAAAPSK